MISFKNEILMNYTKFDTKVSNKIYYKKILIKYYYNNQFEHNLFIKTILEKETVLKYNKNVNYINLYKILNKYKKSKQFNENDNLTNEEFHLFKLFNFNDNDFEIFIYILFINKDICINILFNMLNYHQFHKLYFNNYLFIKSDYNINYKLYETESYQYYENNNNLVIIRNDFLKKIKLNGYEKIILTFNININFDDIYILTIDVTKYIDNMFDLYIYKNYIFNIIKKTIIEKYYKHNIYTLSKVCTNISKLYIIGN